MPNECSLSQERLTDLDLRLRVVEKATIEIAVMGKYVRLLVAILGVSFGVDVSGMM